MEPTKCSETSVFSTQTPGNYPEDSLSLQSNVPDDGRKHRPKHVEPTWNNKLIYIVHLVGYFHNCITMQGVMNVKSITNGFSNVCCYFEFTTDGYEPPVTDISNRST
jgi:hypothetical protein